VFALCKLTLPHLRKVRGNIINISSWVGAFGQSKATTYAATKGATTAFTKALAIDEAAHGVRVNSVSPGNIWTPLWKEGVDADADPTAAREAGERVQVLGRMGTVGSAAPLHTLLCAPSLHTSSSHTIHPNIHTSSSQVLGRMGTILETGRLALCIAADLTFTTGVDHVQSGGAEIGYGLKATAAPAAKPVEAA
jgi:NAD(P)-dependent dehydrogenase (short-subunit alcohol dehydrogenase family)